MGYVDQSHVRITPARLLTVNELDVDNVREICGFLESVQESDGWAVSLLLIRGDDQLKADFTPHIPQDFPIPTNMVVMFHPAPKGICAHLHYGINKVALATLSYESIQKAFPKIQGG